MQAIEKIWTVVYHIYEAKQLAPSNRLTHLHSNTVWSVLGKIDTELILQKLEHDEKVISVLGFPEYRHSDEIRRTCYRIKVLPEFDKYFGKLYSRYTVGIDQLDDYALLRVYDVVLDIRNEITLTPNDTITISILPPVVRFQTLFPADTDGLRDQYSEKRWKCIEFLGHIGVLTSQKLNEAPDRWLTSATITVNRLQFYRAYEKLRDKYRETFGQQSAQSVELLPRPTFDERESKIHFKGKSCEFAHGTCEYYIAKLTFDEFGKKVTEQAVVDAWGQEDKKRSVYQAHRRLNEKVQSELGIPQLFAHKAAHVWVRAELFEPEKQPVNEPEKV